LAAILVIDMENSILSSVNAQIKEVCGGYWNFDA